MAENVEKNVRSGTRVLGGPASSLEQRSTGIIVAGQIARMQNPLLDVLEGFQAVGSPTPYVYHRRRMWINKKHKKT